MWCYCMQVLIILFGSSSISLSFLFNSMLNVSYVKVLAPQSATPFRFCPFFSGHVRTVCKIELKHQQMSVVSTYLQPYLMRWLASHQARRALPNTQTAFAVSHSQQVRLFVIGWQCTAAAGRRSSHQLHLYHHSLALP